MTIVDAYPKLLGIGIDEKAVIVVTGDRFRVIGKGRVAIYDNKKHGNNWYYWLNNGNVFTLRSRSKQTAAPVNCHFAGNRLVMKSATRLADGGLRLAKTAIT